MKKAIVLAAGRGTRMNSPLPKVLHEVGGKPMVLHLLDTLKKAAMDEIVVVIAPDMDDVKKTVYPYQTVVQETPLGTAHAVLSAHPVIPPFDGCVFILFGDSPMIDLKTLRKMEDSYTDGNHIVVVGFEPEDPKRYGRLVVGKNGLERIVEYKDGTEEERKISLCNGGIMCVDGNVLFSLLTEVKPSPVSGEYYLPELVRIGREHGLSVGVVIAKETEVLGINTPEELAAVNALIAEQEA